MIPPPFQQRNLVYALKEIQIRIQVFLAAFQNEHVKRVLGESGVTLSDTGENNSCCRFATPIGAIKVEFKNRRDGDYLGVAATFGFENKEGEQEDRFFVLFMNLEDKWTDSSGVTFSTGGHLEVPESYEIAPLMMRVLTKGLQIQSDKLQAIGS